jgi:hypothetical protein
VDEKDLSPTRMGNKLTNKFLDYFIEYNEKCRTRKMDYWMRVSFLNCPKTTNQAFNI